MVNKLVQHAGNTLIRWQLRWVWLTTVRKLLKATKHPLQMQQDLLIAITVANRDTTFGQHHNFGEISSYADYCQHVPVSEYESLRPYIEAEIERDEKSLTAEVPVTYVRTSGTSGLPKDIPLILSHLISLKRIHRMAVANQYRLCPEAFTGSILAITSPATEGQFSNGKRYGSASGVVSQSTAAVVRKKFVLPDTVLTVSNSRIKYLLILRLALSKVDITHIACANPSTLLTLIELYREHSNELITSVAIGGFFLKEQVPQSVWTSIAQQLVPQPKRAAQLRALHQQTSPVRLIDLWPQLRLVVTWTCASAGVAARSLKNELPSPVLVLELGYLASEFRGTISLGRRADSGMPTFDTHFFEFVERDLWDNGAPLFLTLAQVRKGVDYYVIVTTPSGLYRYFMNDLVRVTGFFNQIPLLKFLQKGKGVTNITGEKLYESQVITAIHAAMKGITAARFIMTLADEDARFYRIYIETANANNPATNGVAALIDSKLAEINMEYSSKRESARLAPPALNWLQPGTEEAYKKFCVERGQREGQFKTVSLTYAKNFQFDLEAFSVKG
ncbi:MAG: GH3 auxin-responsive promoter family protein [Candidatus Nitrotoga sp.]